METFPETSFFKERRAPALPPPANIRAINLQSNGRSATSFDWPPPVMIPSLGLVVKYGAGVSVVEAQTQVMLRERLGDSFPVPEIFGWVEDGGQTFIYMSLVEGDTFLDRWDGLTEDEKQAICAELNYLMKLLRSLEQDPHNTYIGKQSLKDIFVELHSELAGPFEGANAVEQFQDACLIETGLKTSIVFTHNDLLPPNIILSPGPNPKVAAIVDWAQSGWYPAYWEYCKARWVRVNLKYFSDASQEDWRKKYLPIILDPVDDQMYHPWLYFRIDERHMIVC